MYLRELSFRETNESCACVRRNWPEITLSVAACALAVFGFMAFFNVGILSTLPHSSYFSYGSWTGTFLLVLSAVIKHVLCNPIRKEETSTKEQPATNILDQKNQSLREKILKAKPYAHDRDEWEIIMTHANQIADHIVLGDYEAFLSINPQHKKAEGNYSQCEGKQFKLVVSLRSAKEIDETDTPDCVQLGIRRERIFVGDEAGGWSEIRRQFETVFPLMDAAREKGDDILVHCAAGSSRSPAFLYAYLMHSCHITAEQAFKYVHSHRPQAQFDWFKEGLLTYQAELGIA